MTRRIDWRKGATKAGMKAVKDAENELLRLREQAAYWSATRKRIISRCYAHARRAAKGGK